MESFFSTLQKNVLNRQSWATKDQLRARIINWIEATCHRRRGQRRLGKLTPVEYESVHKDAVALAAQARRSTEPSADPGIEARA